jgi:hypothetical protein
VTDISPSSPEVNRRVEQQLNFSSPYFDQLYKGMPEHTPSSGGGGDTKPKPKTKLKSPPTKSPLQHAISSDVTLLIESTILESDGPPVSRPDPPNHYVSLGEGSSPPEPWERYQLEMDKLEELNANLSKIEHQRVLRNVS